MSEAMSFELKCPKCGIIVEADSSLIGKSAECPDCKHIFTIEAPQNTQPEVPTPPINLIHPAPIPPTDFTAPQPQMPPKEFTFQCPQCSEIVELPGILRGREYRCQSCGAKYYAHPDPTQCIIINEPIQDALNFIKKYKPEFKLSTSTTTPKNFSFFLFVKFIFFAISIFLCGMGVYTWDSNNWRYPKPIELKEQSSEQLKRSESTNSYGYGAARISYADANVDIVAIGNHAISTNTYSIANKVECLFRMLFYMLGALFSLLLAIFFERIFVIKVSPQ